MTQATTLNPEASAPAKKPESIYETCLLHKRTWSPVPVSAGKLKEGGEDVILRALSLRALEIPVGNFIDSAMKGDLPDDAHVKDLLRSNVKDEEKHDVALGYAAEAHGVPERYEQEAQVITKSWVEHAAHPVLKARVLETSVFFVLLPIFRYLGDTGLRTISQDVSRDEQGHVKTNNQICKDLGLEPDNTMDDLRRATVSWVLQSLPANSNERHLSKEHWYESSTSLYHHGKAPRLIETRASRMPAFFETAANDLPMYA